MASTVAKPLIPNNADWKHTAMLEWTMLFQMRSFGTALKPLIVFASEAPGFKVTFWLIPLLYPLPSRETVPLNFILSNKGKNLMCPPLAGYLAYKMYEMCNYMIKYNINYRLLTETSSYSAIRNICNYNFYIFHIVKSGTVTISPTRQIPCFFLSFLMRPLLGKFTFKSLTSLRSVKEAENEAASPASSLV